jgi:recombination DNA repair RAD52 pathway protein
LRNSLEEAQNKLAEPFDESQIYQLSKGGRKFDYVSIAEAVARLNACVGIEGWKETDTEAWRDPIDPDWIICRTTVSVLGEDGCWVSKTGYGGEEILRKSDKKPVDLGNSYKSAHSDAFKKTLQKLGVALHLARQDSAILLEEAKARNETEPASDEVKSLLREVIGSSSDEDKERIKELMYENAFPSLREGKDDEFRMGHARTLAGWLGVGLPTTNG